MAPYAHNAADLAAVLSSTDTTMRNASLLAALAAAKSQPLPPVFVEAEDQRPVLDLETSTSSVIPVVDMSRLRSSMITFKPFCVSSFAAQPPLMPEPMTIAS